MTNPSGGTAVAVPEKDLEAKLLSLAGTPEERQFAYAAAAKVRQSQMIRAAAAALAATSWGKDMSEHSRAAVARYALETGTDPVLHWEVLGGRLYDKAALWLDLVASQPDYQGHDFDFIHDDERASPEERARRKAMRVKHAVPEVVKGCCVVTIHRQGRLPTVGCNWAGSYGKKSDPVGDAEPGKTSFTRAFRRSAKTAYSLWFQSHPIRSEEDEVTVETLKKGIDTVLTAEREELKKHPELPAPKVQAQPGLDVHPGSGGAVNVPNDPYDADGDERELDRRLAEGE